MGKAEQKKSHDVVLLHGPTDDGGGLRALRSRPGRLELAEIRPVKKGAPMHAGELVQLKARKGSPLLWDVDVQYSAAEEQGHDGPARVTSEQYRRNWEEAFGADAEEGGADGGGAEQAGGSGGIPVEDRTSARDQYRRNWEQIFGLAETAGDEGEGSDPEGGLVN